MADTYNLAPIGPARDVKVEIFLDPRPEVKRRPYRISITEMRHATCMSDLNLDTEVKRRPYLTSVYDSLIGFTPIEVGDKYNRNDSSARFKTLEKALEHKAKVFLNRDLLVAHNRQREYSSTAETNVWSETVG